MKTILTVDDSEGVCQIAKLTLSSAGYGIVEATEGRDGRAAKANTINMVVTDHRLPDNRVG